MTWKDFWKKSFGGLLIKNILIAFVLIVAAIWFTFWAINKYTEHGVEETVPDLRGAYVEEAEILLSVQGLYPKIIDSVYTRDKRLGTIVEQIPLPGTKMKRNRPVYLIINSRQIRQVTIPGVRDFSSRQASAMLKANGVNIASIQYAPSQYKDLVIDIKYKGESIQPGDKIPDGESVVLIVGRGLGNEETSIPQLKGFTLEEARKSIVSSSFVLGATYYDKNHTEGDEYIVYRQEPDGGKVVPSGTKVNLWLTTDPELLDAMKKGTYTSTKDEEFF